jgi:hypothetical protein
MTTGRTKRRQRFFSRRGSPSLREKAKSRRRCYRCIEYRKRSGRRKKQASLSRVRRSSWGGKRGRDKGRGVEEKALQRKK